MMRGENIMSGASPTCTTCKKTPDAEVLRSAAGYYIGTRCECGPYSRESDYFPSEESAKKALPIYKAALSGLIVVTPIPEQRTTEYRPGSLTVEILDENLNPTGEIL